MSVSVRQTLCVMVFLSAFAFAGCEDDGGPRAPVQIMDMVEFLSDSDGITSLMVKDDGDTLRLSKPEAGFPADTVTRYMVVYRTTKAVPYDIAVISSMGPPVTARIRRYKAIYSDSVKVKALWCGSKYLNLHLKLDDFGGAHYFGFAWLGWTVNPDSSRNAHIALYHYARQYEGYFSREAYVSCILEPLVPMLRKGRDSISVMTNEFGKGITWRTVPY